MLTARSRPEDVLKGFEADEAVITCRSRSYLEICLARLNGLLRRREWSHRETTKDRIGDTFEINGKTIGFLPTWNFAAARR